MDISDLVRTLLTKRGITEESAMSAFLDPNYERDTHNPFLFQGMDRAVARILAALSANERIAIYGDFDCDGIPGSVVMYDFFQKVGHTNLEVYLPHRDREGHGFHKEAVDELSESGVSLIITVDVGTTAVETVEHARSKGIDVIITDHHEILDETPNPIALINPKLAPYPFRDLCGAAVAWKLVQATILEGRKRGDKRFEALPEGWEKWLLDMVALGTIADMVPMVGENRALVHFGLKVLRKSPRPGIAALMNRVRLKQTELTEDDVGFSIAPRINAASRMDEPDSAFRLLVTDDRNEAERIAEHLEELNAKRKGAVSAIVRHAKRSIRERFRENERVVVMGNPEWKPGILGLAANSILAERGGLVCLWGRDAMGKLKGSCRSDGAVSIAELFKKVGDALIEAGGHANSGGFSVSHERVHTLPEVFAEAGRALEQVAQKKDEVEGVYDTPVSLPELSPRMYEDVSRLAPFGLGNPKPVFRVNEIVITEMRRFGRDAAHLELKLECRRSGVSMRAFDFFRAPENFSSAAAVGVSLPILATLERDTYRGGLALRLIDIL